MTPLDYRASITFNTPEGVMKVEVRELTVATIRKIMAGEVVEPSDSPSALDVALWGADPLAEIEVMPADIPRFSDLTLEQSEGLTISQRKALVEKIREVNAGFFGLVSRWPGVVAELVARRTQRELLGDSSGLSPP